MAAPRLVVHMIGNAHIDPVWLWGWQAGVDEALATLSAAADRCDETPDFVFTRGEAWLFRQAERLRPALFARIRRQVAEGRWCLVGGTLVQPDLNLPTEMSLRRQIAHGQAYFQSRFGLRARIGWNVDSFGHPAFLPDLLAAHGYTAYVLGRPDPRQLSLPAAAFLWRGAGGAALPAFRVADGYAWSAPDLAPHIAQAVAASDPALGHTMCLYGVGNHGGGPTRRQIAWIEAHRTALPGLELRLSTPAAFFAAIAPHRHRLPVIAGELQHCFPGCYSAMGDIKRAQRAGEHALDQAERAARAFGGPSALPRIDAAWDDLLFTAFHDIVTGTSTPSAWASCRAMQGRARIAAEEALLDITRNWADRALPPAAAQRIVVLNTDDTPFDGLVEHESWADHELWQDRQLLAQDGTPVPYQLTQPDAAFRVPRLLFPARIAAGSAATFTIRPGTPPTPPPGPRATPTRLANARLSLDLAPTGIAALARDGRSLLGPGGITLQLRHDPTDTWTYWTDRFAEPLAATLAGGAWTVDETGPLRAGIRMDHRLGTSRLRWTLSLDRDTPALRLRLDINFDERLTLLQLAIDLPAPPLRRTDAIPGGAIARPLSPAEFPVQGWSRLACPAGELALVTQDAFSLSANGTLWQWTLLRSPRMAWQGTDPPVYHARDTHTDQGTHGFTFLLLADDTLPDTLLDTAARRLAQPLVTFERTEGAERPFFG